MLRSELGLLKLRVRETFHDATAILKRETESLLQNVTDRPRHDRRYALDPSKIEREPGFKSTINFEEELRKTVEWYLNSYAH